MFLKAEKTSEFFWIFFIQESFRQPASPHPHTHTLKMMHFVDSFHDAQNEEMLKLPKASDCQKHKMGAECGIIEDMENTAVCYLHGIGVEKDEQKALSWYRSAISKRRELLHDSQSPEEDAPDEQNHNGSRLRTSTAQNRRAYSNQDGSDLFVLLCIFFSFELARIVI